MENSVVCVASCQSLGNSEDQSVMTHSLMNKEDLKSRMSPEDAPSVSPLAGVEGDSVGVHESMTQMYVNKLGLESECLKDVERFDGKIVYNPDGSAYIIEGDDDDLEEEVKVIPKLEGCIVEDSKAEVKTSQVPAYPQIANAIYVTKNPSFYTGLYGHSYMNTIEKKKLSEAPVMHTFRVYTMRGKDKKDMNAQKNGEVDRKPVSMVDYSSVPIKPILMCFICKLSFGYVKSFVSHAMSDHSIKLAEEEKEILGQKNCSAIIQCVGKEKETLISFLEPVAPYISASDSHDGRLQKTALTPAGSSSLTTVSSYFDNSSSEQVSTSDTDGAVKLFSPTAVPNTQVNRIQQMGSSSDSPDRPPSRSSPVKQPTDSNMQCFSHRSREGLDLSLKTSNGESFVMSKTPPVTSAVTGTTIGACPEHINGRPTGVECANCDLILSSSQSLAGQMALQMSSRNSCKTLKCPKCNWHYKYQETLEIHMKEKHPENETSCIYCITNQPHPRLARGESYTCGYKPYRCEVCNYSTTTKGNLSIHMQSDKHLNNMQELQNGGVPTPSSVTPSSESPSTPLHPNTSPSPVSQKPKPKPTWRCDVCNYETNVARNLRIHMTSEKHTHNMMVLQQNVKQMQQMSAFHAQSQGGFDPSSMLSFMPGMTFPGDKPPPHTEAALADMAYNQALFIQMITSGQMSPQMHNEILNSMNEMSYTHENNASNDLMDSIEPNPKHLFQCCVCCVFSSDSVDGLNIHMSQDRTKTREQEILMLVAGNYICKLCNYKTNLKANFQLHCKTDKHLQRLQHINHIKEGGPLNEWRLKYMNLSNPVQVRCNACDFYTNSTHKLQVHVTNQQHEIGAMLFWHLRKMETSVTEDNRLYHCTLCNFSSQAKMHLIKHVRSMKHLQMENLHQLKRRSEGIDIPEDIGEIFQVRVREEIENCSDTSECNDKRTAATSDDTRGGEDKETPEKDSSEPEESICGNEEVGASLPCPLCQEKCAGRSRLEQHATQVHNVTSEGLNRLLLLVEPSIQQTSRPSPNDRATSQSPEKMNTSKPQESDALSETERSEVDYSDDSLKCPTCNQMFKSTDELYSHQNELGHLEIKQTPRGLGYVCWKKGCNKYFPSAQNLQNHFTEIHATPQSLAVSEKHVYKYRCNQCSLAFKTMEKLQLHFQYHAIRDATKCVLCGRNFRSIHALYKHVETHSELTEVEIQQYKMSLMNNPFLLAGMSGQVLDPSTNELLKKEGFKDDDAETEDSENKDNDDETMNDVDSGSEMSSARTNEQQMIEDYLNSQAMAEDSYSDPNRKYKCHRCKVAFTRQSYLTSHNKTLLHRKGEKLSYPMEKYLDPNRPYKCEVCKESFTQKNILLVHYNSVSHLHKLKRSLQEQQQMGVSLPSQSPNPSPSLGSPTPMIKEEEDKKPYKCNICKVAYSQGSTLDIHIRSVLHQTRAAKLQELAATGQLDLTKPLIEQPDPQKIQEQQKKFLQDILNTSKSIVGNTSSHPSPVNEVVQPDSLTKVTPSITSPVFTSASTNHNSPNSTPPSTATCQRCCATFTSAEELNQHQQLYCIFNSSLPVFSTLTSSGPLTSLTGGHPNTERSEISSEVEQDQSNIPKFNMPTRKSSHIYRHLLESYGFEVVMQFNEYNQKQIRELETDSEPSELDKLDGFPELGKSICPLCKKTFSSVWVLKSHREEVHGESIPINFLEKFADAFKQDFDKKYPELKSDEGTCDISVGNSECVSDDKVNPMQQSDTVLQHNDTYMNSPSTSTVSENPSQQVSTAQSAAAAQNSFLQQMSDMNSALSAMAASQMQQLQFNPMMMSLAGLGMTVPFGMNMQALAAMNLQPPLVPFMMPPPMGMDPLAAAALMHSQQGSMIPPTVDTKLLSHQKSLPHQQPTPSQQKRARTRISDEQLKILRAHFDINNSPTEDQINDMAQKSGLPPKVIKHWFRNTLFKERQRNKDSPYNFSNPPCTTLNLEEYETNNELKSEKLCTNPVEVKSELKHHEIESKPIKQEPERNDYYPSISRESLNVAEKEMIDARLTMSNDDKKCGLLKSPGCDTSQSTPSYPNMPSISTPSPLNISSMMTSSSSTPESNVQSHPFPQKMAHMFSNQLSGSNLLPPISTPSATPSPSRSDIMGSSSSTASGKRANRTRFTDYQIKVLQEFFENNAYPKDDDLEYLSKLLNLSPRVIVVWFQNARQKARKVYENQPPVDPNDEGSGRFQRTPGLNYQCKKCLLVFQRYYELIRHQKSHCFKEEDAKRSAQAQAAAAAAAAACAGQSQNHHQMMGNSGSYSDDSNSSSVAEASHSSNVSTDSKSAHEGSFQCDHCKLIFPRFDLWREHQIIHLMNPNLFPTYATGNMFGSMSCEGQAMASMHGMESARHETASPKRKFSEDDEERDDQPRDKRLRTTILPEQLDYLYQKYQVESNPSRKMLETIASEVGLTKRVVQVWFQNTRARERKGQFRAHAQVINKRCPFCPALFKVKSAFESHLAYKHPEQYSKGDINIDSLPDEPESENEGSAKEGSHTPGNTPAHLVGSYQPSETDQDILRRHYEETMKKFLIDLESSARGMKTSGEPDFPLDLSKPLDVSKPVKSINSCTDMSYKHEELHKQDNDDMHFGDSDGSDIEGDNGFESSPTSPASSTQSHRLAMAGKRYRTQMSNVQVQVMKTIFHDYKTPAMSECEVLGREVGLPKRVVQVWFQNARAKEKKYKLTMQKNLGLGHDTSETSKPPEVCKLCNFRYSHKYSVQDHLFSKGHIDAVRALFDKGKGEDLHAPRSDPASLQNQLQIMQHMASAAGLKLPGMDGNEIPSSMANTNGLPSTSLSSASSNPATQNETERMLMQMYGMSLQGYGGVLPSSNPIIQAMYSGQTGLLPEKHFVKSLSIQCD